MKSISEDKSIEVGVVTDLGGAQSLEREWDDLLDGSDCKDVTYSFRWYANWLRSFAANGKVRIMTTRENGRLTSILPLIEGEYMLRRRRVKALLSMTNLHSVRYDMISAEDCERNLGRCLAKAFDESEADFMVLSLVPEESLIIRYLANACRGVGCRFLVRNQHENRLVLTQPSFAQFFGSLSSKFRKNVNAAERKACARGELRLVSLDDENLLESYLDRGVTIEASGWKGEQGSAIIQAPHIRSFYEKIARDFFRKGWLRLYLLENSGEDISFYFCVGNYGVVRAIKIGVRQEYAGIGPGMLITKKVLEEIHRCGTIATWDFCGGSARWKSDWSNASERYHSIYIFKNNIFGRMLYAGARAYSRFKHVAFAGRRSCGTR